ncbi:MAG: hypothetical protein OXM00_04165, partial [Paracoccaceae bacterium]|nr:hypothetical protein [Paracoccaceae bacterium]
GGALFNQQYWCIFKPLVTVLSEATVTTATVAGDVFILAVKVAVPPSSIVSEDGETSRPAAPSLSATCRETEDGVPTV